MTNKLQLVPGHFSSTERAYNQLPALFSSRWFDSIFDGAFPEKVLEDSSAFYPYNISVVRDVGQIDQKYIIEVALAGVGKDNISIDVKDDILTISVSKEDKEPLQNQAYLKKGISRRKSNFSYKLDTNQVDVKKIQSTYIDGLLALTIPVKRKETHKIDIKVNID